MEGCTQKIIIVLLTAAVLMMAACNESNTEPYRLSNGDKALLSQGDIIMRRGKGMLSTIIVRSLNDSTGVSHCGIIDRRGDSIYVIHCLSDEVSDIDGVQECTLDEFTEESVRGTVAVVRFRTDDASPITEAARYYLKERKPFDHKFNISDTAKFFCSEMPLRILSDRMGVDLTGSNKTIKFSLFYNPQYFSVILNHNK